MKPLIDALGEIIAVYDLKRPCRLCSIRAEELDHADACAWATLNAWHKDVTAMVEGIRHKPGSATEAKPNTSLPAEIRERGA